MIKDDLFDEELQSMVPLKEAQQPKSKPKSSNVVKPKAASTIEVEPDSVFEESSNGYVEPLKRCAKWAVLFGGLSLLIFYWQQSGQMTDSAAVPSLYICALLAGLSVGKAWKVK